MNIRLLIVLLVILVVLFAVGVGAGALPRANAGFDRPPGFVAFLGAFGDQARLSLDDIVRATPGACLEQLRQTRLALPQGFACTFFIRRAQPLVRSLRLDIAPGQTAEVVYAPGNPNHFTARQRLNAARPLILSVFQEGGELHIACLNPGALNACTLTVR